MIFTGNHGRRRAQNNGQSNSQRRRSSNVEVNLKQMKFRIEINSRKNSTKCFRDAARPHRDCHGKILESHQAILICIPIPHHHHHHHRHCHLIITRYHERAVAQHI
jgi:hypothetical protein